MTFLLQTPQAVSNIGGGTLAAYVALAVSILTPLVAVLNAWSGRKTKRERDAGAWQAEAQGGAIATGTPLEWRTTDHQALLDERSFSAETRTALKIAEQKVRELSDSIAECDRRVDALQEDLRQQRTAIHACPGGPPCPLRPVGLLNPTAVPPPES